MKTNKNTKYPKLEKELYKLFREIYPESQVNEAIKDSMKAYSMISKEKLLNSNE